MEFFIQNQAKDLRKRKIKFNSRETINPEEVFLDKLAQKKEAELGISEKKFEVPLRDKILRGFYFFCLILFSILFVRTFYFQIIQGQNYRSLAEDNSERFLYERPDRGVIYDSEMRQLVSNVPSFDLVLDRRDLPEDEFEIQRILTEIAKIIQKDGEALKTQIEQSGLSVILISENLDHETLLLLEPKIISQDFKGFYIEKNTVRDYKFPYYFSHILGYLGKVSINDLEADKSYSITDYIGKEGLEKYYEEILRGMPGITKIVKDAKGQKKYEEKISSPEQGASIVLSINSDLQKTLEDSLQKSLENIGAAKGAAVAMDPKTGGILSMVSLPSFNNNLFSKGISQDDFDSINRNPLKPMFNRALAGEYPSGSTIKPLMGIAGLQEGVITPKTKINDPEGKICVKNQWNPESSDCFGSVKPCGVMDIYSAIAESCNVYFYTIGGGHEDFKGLGLAKIKKWLNIFNWGNLSGVDLPGEKAGLVPDDVWKKENVKSEADKAWYLGDTYNLSIGQGFLKITPLQVAAAFVPIANGGTFFKPRLVKEIIESPSVSAGKKEPEILKQNIAAAKNIEVIQRAMRDAVVYGSSVILNSLPVEVAAKTGTAQSNKKGLYYSWVTVFAPLDSPEIVLTVVVEDVKEGQVAALPVARDTLEWFFTRH